MVIYAMAFEASIGALFLGGVIPGLMMGLTLMVTVFLVARKRNYPRRDRRADFIEIWRSFKKAFFPLLTPVILLGGIFSGVFTPTEAAAAAGGVEGNVRAGDGNGAAVAEAAADDGEAAAATFTLPAGGLIPAT